MGASLCNEIIPDFDDIVIEVHVAIDQHIVSWFQSTHEGLVGHLNFEDSLIPLKTMNFEVLIIKTV